MFKLNEDDYYYIDIIDAEFILMREDEELIRCSVEDCDGIFKIALYCILVNTEVVNEVMMSGAEEWDEYEYLIEKAMDYINE